MKLSIPSKVTKSTSKVKVVQDSSTPDDAPSLYARIVELREDPALSYAKIAAKLAVSKSKVSKYLKNEGTKYLSVKSSPQDVRERLTMW